MLITINIYLFLTFLRRFRSCLWSLHLQSPMEPGDSLLSYVKDFSTICVSPNSFISQQLKAVSLHSRIPEGYHFHWGISSPTLILTLTILLPLYCCVLLLLLRFIFQCTPSTYTGAVAGMSVNGGWFLWRGDDLPERSDWKPLNWV